MSRAEFSKPVKREALKRSGGKCEALGAWYGLDEGQRCGANLGFGVEFDHITLAANGGEATLENCCCACISCHRWKTQHHDIVTAAKTVRQRDKNNGIRRPSSMAGSRNSPWKKRMDGTTVRR